LEFKIKIIERSRREIEDAKEDCQLDRNELVRFREKLLQEQSSKKFFFYNESMLHEAIDQLHANRPSNDVVCILNKIDSRCPKGEGAKPIYETPQQKAEIEGFLVFGEGLILPVIKFIRALTLNGCGLKEGKELVEWIRDQRKAARGV